MTVIVNVAAVVVAVLQGLHAVTVVVVGAYDGHIIPGLVVYPVVAGAVVGYVSLGFREVVAVVRQDVAVAEVLGAVRHHAKVLGVLGVDLLRGEYRFDSQLLLASIERCEEETRRRLVY